MNTVTYVSRDETVTAFRLTADCAFWPYGGKWQRVRKGDYFVQRENGIQELMKKDEFEERYHHKGTTAKSGKKSNGG